MHACVASGDDVHHLRSYRRGDARRAIAWKPSARRDHLLVREYEQPLGAEVVLDWWQLSGLDNEARIRRLARWVDDAEREGRRYRLDLPGHAPLGPGSGPQQRHACLRALALLPASDASYLMATSLALDRQSRAVDVRRGRRVPAAAVAATAAAAGAGALASPRVVVAAASWRRPLHALVRLLLAAALVGAVLALSHFAFGRDTGCALLAAMLALKPAETFHLRDARSLLGFALFAPFATFLLDQGPMSLLLGLVGAILALAALLRLAELESGDGRHPTSAWQRFTGVWKLAAIGLPLALAAFWLFPRLATPLWGVPERAMARPGLSDRMSPGEWIDLLNDDSTALRVQFFGATPPTSQMYWRGPVLWNFDGRTWTQPGWLRGVPGAPVRSTGTHWDYQLEIEPTDSRQLVALDLPAFAPDGTRLSLDYGLYARRPLSTLSRWRMRSAPPAAFEPQLKSILRRMALALPPGYNPRTIALAQRWRREAGGNDAAVVERAMRDDPGRLRIHARDAVARSRFDRRIPVRAEGRLLRTLQLGLRRADARGRDPGTRRHRVRRRLSQSPGRLLAGAALRCARVDGSVAAGPRLGARRPDRRGRARADLRHARRPRPRCAKDCSGPWCRGRFSTRATGCAMAGTTSRWVSTRRASAGCSARSASRTWAWRGSPVSSSASRCWPCCGWRG